MASSLPKRIGPYVVGVMDVLNQRSNLAELEAQSLEQNRDGLNRAVRDTFGRVEQLRLSAERTAKTVASSDTSKRAYHLLKPDERKPVARQVNVEIATTRFADTILVYSPLIDDSGHLLPKAVLAVASAMAVTMLAALADKIAVRGCIDYGTAGLVNPGGLYGPVLARAHYLESEVAQWPRIVVGSYLMNLLQSIPVSQSGKAALVQAEFASMCHELIEKDVDGCFVIDYTTKRFLAGSGVAPEILHEAQKWAESEASRFREKRDHKLALRFALLSEFLRQKAATWQH